MATYDASVTLEAQSSASVGISERKIESSVAIASGSSVASGVSERQVNASATLQSQTGVVTGVAENEVPAENGQLVSSLSTTTGQSERTVVIESGIGAPS